MSYEHHVARVAEHVVALIATPEPVATGELALDATRLSVRRLCRTVLADLVPDEPAGRATIADLGARPVATLRALLEHDPDPFDPARIARHWIDHSWTTATGHLWHDLRRDATLAAHEWSMPHQHAHPTGEAVWPLVTDIAALAEASALLDRDIARHHPTWAGASLSLRGRDAWEFAVAAEQVRRYAESGPQAASRLPLRSQHTGMPTPLRRAVVASVLPVLDVTVGIRDVIDRHVSAGQWYRHERSRHPAWRRTTAADDLPVVTMASTAAEEARKLVGSVRRRLPDSSHPSAPSPRDVLGSELVQRDRRRTGAPSARAPSRP